MKTAQNTRLLIASLALAATASLPFSAVADEVSYRKADTNKDGFVSRQEYVDYQGMMFDKHHGEMMKRQPSMKPDMMDLKQYSEFDKNLRLPGGRIDPGKVGGK